MSIATITLAETWHAYARSVAAELRPSTLESYRRSMDDHVLPVLGSATLASLTPGRIRAFADAELARGVSPKTVRSSVGVIRTALAGLVSHGVLRSNPASIRRGSLPRPGGPGALSRSELLRFLDASRGDPLEDLLLFLGLTGVRLREALALAWRDIDLDAGTAIIRGALRLRRKRMPTLRLGYRTIDLPAPVVAALERRRAGTAEAALVFEADERGGRVSARHVHDAFKRAAERAGLAVVTPHVLRHTWATTLLEAGVPVSYVSRSLGHSSPAFTASAYAAPPERASRHPAKRPRGVPARAPTQHSGAL